jgi:hypothetical protein
MGAEMEMETEVEMETVEDSTAVEPVLEMGTDSTAKVKSVKLVTETEVDAMGTAIEPNLKMEVDTTVQASKEILDLEANDSVKETDTTDRSCLEMAPTIRNDSQDRPPSIRR